MPALPESKHQTVSKVYEWYASQKQTHRPHLGASLIGHPCDRYLWLTFRWAALPNFPGRMLRLFDTGKREEERVFKELAGIGVTLHTEENGRQIECRDKTGHFGGSVDGVGKGFLEAPKTWAVLEIKTHNTKSHADLVSKGVKESKPRHFAQMQIYMGLMDIERAMYYAVCKDTDEIYCEWVHFEKEAFDQLLARAHRIIESTQPPVKISDDPAHWQCKTCDMYAFCHQGHVAMFNCRTCCHASPVEKGQWQCEKRHMTLSKAEQNAGCDEHLFIPALVSFGEPIDGGENYVEYRHKVTGKTFRNGPGHYMSQELAKSCEGTVTEPIVEAMRSTFNAKVVGSKGRRKDLSKLPAPTEPFLDDDLSQIKF